MLRYPIVDDFTGRGYVPNLDPPMSCLLFMGWHECLCKVITFPHCDRMRIHFIDLGKSLYKFKLSLPYSFIKSPVGA